MEQFEKRLNEKVHDLERILKSYLPEEKGEQATVIRAMNYSILAGGKRLRPMLMGETYRLFGGKSRIIEPFMAAIEMVHNYSLVHDDLPAMDNDEYRRGRKTTHVVYGEAMAILAGDGLLNYAFETAFRAFDYCEGDRKQYEAVGEALKVLGEKAGIYGMIGGQTADIEAENTVGELSMDRLLFIHEHKTSALIQASMMIGAILAGADRKEVEAIEKCAYNVGIAFQIQDDILDITGDEATFGKPIGSDEKNHKQTYVTMKGLEQAREEVQALSEEAITILDSCPGENLFLRELLLQLIHREK